MLNLFRKNKVIRPSPEDIEAYSQFDPNPAMVGMTSSGPMVVDEKTGLVGTLTPKLSTFRASDGGRIYGVEFGLDGAIPFSDVEATKPKKSNFLRYAATALGIAGVGFAVASCGGSSGGGGGNPGPGPVLDVTPPGSITDLAVVNPAGTYVEDIALKWTSPGDDGNVGEPSFFVVKYTADNPIMTEAQWNAATDLGTVAAAGAAGTGYSVTLFPVQPGNQCFAMKAYDEANNVSGLSNSVCMGVISKAQNFVDFYLPTGRFYLDFDEVESMMQGDAPNGIPSRALDIGTVLATVATPPYNTPAAMEAYLKKMTDTVYDPLGNNYEVCSKAIGGLVQSALYWESINIPKHIILNARAPPTECSPGVADTYTPLTDQNMTDLRNIIREHLMLWVDANKSQYCDLIAVSCPEGEEWGINH